MTTNTKEDATVLANEKSVTDTLFVTRVLRDEGRRLARRADRLAKAGETVESARTNKAHARLLAIVTRIERTDAF